MPPAVTGEMKHRQKGMGSSPGRQLEVAPQAAHNPALHSMACPLAYCSLLPSQTSLPMRACSCVTGMKGSSCTLLSPAVYTLRSMPKRPAASTAPKVADMTPTEPTRLVGRAYDLSPAHLRTDTRACEPCHARRAPEAGQLAPAAGCLGRSAPQAASSQHSRAAAAATAAAAAAAATAAAAAK